MWLWRTRHLLAARRAYKSLANRSVVLRNVSLKMTETTVIDKSEWVKEAFWLIPIRLIYWLCFRIGPRLLAYPAASFRLPIGSKAPSRPARDSRIEIY